MFEFERATNITGLHNAWQKVSRNNSAIGVDGIDLSYYRSNLSNNLRTLNTALTSGRYEPYREMTAHAGDRTIYISCLDDKIVQTALATVLTSDILLPQSVHGYVKNRSVFTAIKKLNNAITNGMSEFYKADVQSFYQNVNKHLLLKQLKQHISDARYVKTH